MTINDYVRRRRDPLRVFVIQAVRSGASLYPTAYVVEQARGRFAVGTTDGAVVFVSKAAGALEAIAIAAERLRLALVRMRQIEGAPAPWLVLSSLSELGFRQELGEVRDGSAFTSKAGARAAARAAAGPLFGLDLMDPETGRSSS